MSLEKLIFDPNLGHLYPHRHAASVLGCNESQLRRLRPHLTEGRDWVKLQCQDRIKRIFYTLSGLRELNTRLNTPESQSFLQTLESCLNQQKSGGVASEIGTPQDISTAASSTQPQPQAIASSAPPVTERKPSVVPVASVPPSHVPSTDDLNRPSEALDSTPQRASTSDAIARSQPQAIASYVLPVTERNPSAVPVASVPPSQVPSAYELTPHRTAELIFQAQRVVGDQIAKTNASRPITILERSDRWLSSQDTAAIAIVAVLLMVLMGLGTFFLTRVVWRPTPSIEAPQTLYPQG
ncbi:MAG: hypothetical protein AAFY26_12005 [Cyanobacteria bacterium J06638_22]